MLILKYTSLIKRTAYNCTVYFYTLNKFNATLHKLFYLLDFFKPKSYLYRKDLYMIVPEIIRNIIAIVDLVGTRPNI